jgi:hypothetical protein
VIDGRRQSCRPFVASTAPLPEFSKRTIVEYRSGRLKIESLQVGLALGLTLITRRGKSRGRAEHECLVGEAIVGSACQCAARPLWPVREPQT